jgi:hypothetical protein
VPGIVFIRTILHEVNRKSKKCQKSVEPILQSDDVMRDADNPNAKSNPWK